MRWPASRRATSLPNPAWRFAPARRARNAKLIFGGAKSVPEFTYEAMAGTGQRSNGTLTANSEREVMALLDARGLFPLRIAAAKSASAASSRWGRKIKGRHICTFFSQLADLLRSGVPLLRSLDVLERQSSTPALSEIIREVRA